MNKTKSILLAALLAVPVITNAQTTTNAPPTGLVDLGNTVLGWLTTFNTNLDSTFGSQRFDLWTGVSSIQGGPVPLVNDLGISYDLWRGSGSTNSVALPALSIENVIRDGGVAGTLVSEQPGLGLSIIVHDVRLTLYVDAVVDLASKNIKFGDRLDGEVGIRAAKALGTHFWTGVGMGARFLDGGRVFSAMAGVTF